MDMQSTIYWDSLRAVLAPVVPYLDDASVSEIMINGPTAVYVERAGKIEKVEVKFDDKALMVVTRNLAQYVGKEIHEGVSHMAARLPDGSRVQVVLPPCSHSGVCFAIRKFSRKLLGLKDLIEKGSLSQKGADWLSILMKMRKNTIISGGTGSGKTSMLNILASMADPMERVLVMEDTQELQIERDHILYLEARPPLDKTGRGEVTIRDLVKVALRMRPDRIVLGEVRGGEAMDLLQAMSTGHAGSMGTLHANDPEGALRRLETMATYGGGEIPISAIRSQVASSVEVVVQINRFGDGSRRVTHISEVLQLGADQTYKTKDIFRFQLSGKSPDGRLLGELLATGETSTFVDQLPYYGIELSPDFFRAESPSKT